MTGMPLDFLAAKTTEFQFKNEKFGTKILSSVQQDKAFKQFRENGLNQPSFTIFNSSPTDQEALSCCTSILRKNHRDGFHEFEFVHATEKFPKQHQIKGLYVVLGCNAKDPEIAHHVRRWVRTPSGASIWLILTSTDPIGWSKDNLGLPPHFVFSLRTAAISVG